MKPNIIILVLDGLRARNLSLYGYPRKFDENISKIASESLFFENHFSSSNATYPSVTSLFTGKYPINHGIVHTYPWTSQEEIEKLKKNKFWLPIYLRRLGYDTYLMSLTRLWVKKGFNYVEKEPKKDPYRKINDKKIVRKIIKLFPDWLYVLIKKIMKRDPALNILEGRELINSSISKIKESKKPFFILIHLEDTHYPWPTTKTPKMKGEKTMKKLSKEIKNKAHKQNIKRMMFNVSATSLEQMEERFNMSVRYVDKQVGRFYSFLKKEDLLNNSIFIILADHGESITEHFYLEHGLYDEAIHVPLVMHLPNIKPKRIKEFVQNIDIVPTILEFLGEKKIKTDGKSLLNLIKKGALLRNKIFSFDGGCEKRWCVRNEGKKVIFAANKKCYSCKGEHGEEIEEYDLIKDPLELNNIHKDKYELKEFDPDFKFK